MIFIGAEPDYSTEDSLNTVTANLILNIGFKDYKYTISPKKYS